jgi:hypothetical protein
MPEVDVISPVISGGESVNDWVMIDSTSLEAMLVTTSSKLVLVGTSSLEITPEIEGISTSSVVAMAVLSAPKVLVNTSASEETMVGTEGEGSILSVVLESLVSVSTELSPPTIADRLSMTPREAVMLGVSTTTLSTILISLPKMVGLVTASTGEVGRVSSTEAVDGKTAEIESTSLSSGWVIAVSIEISAGTDGLVTVQISKLVPPTLTVKSELTLISTAVDEAEMTRDGSMTPSPADRASLMEGNEADTVNNDVGISDPRSVAVAPTLIPADMESNWLIVGSAITGIVAEASIAVISAVMSVTLGRSVLKVAWKDGNTVRSLTTVGIVSDTIRDTSETMEDSIPRVGTSDAASVSEGKRLGSSAGSVEVLLGSKIPLTRLGTLRSMVVGMAADADTTTSSVGIDDSGLVSSPRIVLWGTEVIWAELSMLTVGSISEIDSRSETGISVAEAVILGPSVITDGGGVKSDRTTEGVCMLNVVTSRVGSIPARVDSGKRDVSWDPSKTVTSGSELDCEVEIFSLVSVWLAELAELAELMVDIGSCA